ncbi:MAG: hypothetical protein HY791_09750 [Deltaproteobacteria bacterium]|nr:hypothetical protein [Deltaproteobacteria bacterium]
MKIAMSTIETHSSIEGYFSELLTEALDAEKLTLTTSAQAYLVQIAAEYGSAQALHRGARPGERGTPALVWLYEEAHRVRPSERFDAYRRMGDVALVVSGFYTPHIERSLVDVRYYIGMGEAAYAQCASLAELRPFRAIFEQLAGTFDRLVEVFTRVAERTTMPVARDIASLYERWLRNPDSGPLARRLLAQGAVPIFGSSAA